MEKPVFNLGSPAKILIINPFGIGDVLFTTPLIHSLTEAFPGVGIGFLCNRRSRDMLLNNPFIEKVHIYERDEFVAARRKSFFLWLRQMGSFLASIKKESYSLVLDLSMNSQFGFLAWAAGIKHRLGYDFKGRGRFLNRKIKLSGFSDQHVVQYYGSLLRAIGIALKYDRLELYLSGDEVRWANDFLNSSKVSGSGFVAVIPGSGASWGKQAYLKRWPPERFAQVADKIIEKYGVSIIIMGSQNEQDVCENMLSAMGRPALNLCAKTTLRQFAALINRAGLVLTNDGGPLHIASALDKKTVSFFGPVDPCVYGPYPQDPARNIILFSDIECRPCYRKFRMEACKRDGQCLKDISAARVMEAVNTLLNQPDPTTLTS